MDVNQISEQVAHEFLEYSLGCFFAARYPTACLLAAAAEEHYAKLPEMGSIERAAIFELKRNLLAKFPLLNPKEITDQANALKRWLKHGGEAISDEHLSDWFEQAVQLICRALANRAKIFPDSSTSDAASAFFEHIERERPGQYAIRRQDES